MLAPCLLAGPSSPTQWRRTLLPCWWRLLPWLPLLRCLVRLPMPRRLPRSLPSVAAMSMAAVCSARRAAAAGAAAMLAWHVHLPRERSLCVASPVALRAFLPAPVSTPGPPGAKVQGLALTGYPDRSCAAAQPAAARCLGQAPIDPSASIPARHQCHLQHAGRDCTAKPDHLHFTKG